MNYEAERALLRHAGTMGGRELRDARSEQRASNTMEHNMAVLEPFPCPVTPLLSKQATDRLAGL